MELVKCVMKKIVLNNQLEKWIEKVKGYVMPKFDIIISSEGCAQKTENGVYAGSSNELRGLYEMCGEQIQIVKQYPDEVKKENKSAFIPPEIVTPIMNADLRPFPKTNDSSGQFERLFVPPTDYKPEKIIVVDGKKIKIIGGDVYRYDWVNYKECDDDIRVISIKTSKVINMDGKMIQRKEWIKQ